MRNLYVFTLLIAFFSIINISNSQSFQWAKTIKAASTTHPLSPNAIGTDGAGYIYAAGRFTDTMYCNGTLVTTIPQGSYLRNGYLIKYDTAGTVKWVELINSDNAEIKDMIVDSLGNIFVTGQYQGASTFGSILDTSINSSGDFFVAKYDSSGAIQWLNTQGDLNGNSWIDGITMDGANNIYVSGGFTIGLNFGGTPLASVGNNDFFVAKYNSAGSLIWVRSAGGKRYEYVESISASPAGDVFVTGTFDSTMVCGTFTVTPQASGLFNSDIFLIKYDSSGTVQWIETATGAAAPQHSVNDVCATPEGDAYIIGSFGTALYLSTGSVTSAGLDDMYIAKYTSSGTPAWIKRLGGSGYENAWSMALNDSGDIFIAGTFGNTVIIGSNTFTAINPGVDIFVAKFDSTFTTNKWALKCGGNDTDVPNSIALGADQKDVYVFGSYYGNASYGAFSVTPNGGTYPDIFLTKINNQAPNGINEKTIDSGTLQLFPNPVSEKFYVNMSGVNNEDVSVKLVSLTGQILFEENVNSLQLNGQYSISTKNLADGIYFVMIQEASGKTICGKVCKQ